MLIALISIIWGIFFLFIFCCLVLGYETVWGKIGLFAVLLFLWFMAVFGTVASLKERARQSVPKDCVHCCDHSNK